MGRKTDILVTIKENPVNSINYITNHKYEFVENTNGIFKNIYATAVPPHPITVETIATSIFE